MRSTRLVSTGGGNEPRWSHSGKELFFKGGGRMMAVDVVPGAAFTFGTPHALFPLSGIVRPVIGRSTTCPPTIAISS